LDVTAQFPELLIAEKAFRATSAVFDGEIVCLDASGKPDFQQVIHRMQQKTEGGIARGQAGHPAVCYLFDCLYLDGRPITNEPLLRRREWLEDAVRKETPYRVSQTVAEGAALFEAAREMGLEGIMAKQRDSVYLPGKRTDAWVKIKTRRTTECLVIGYTEGRGDRQSRFGALHLGRAKEGGMEYLGKVGSGFDDRSMKAVWLELEKLPRLKKPIKEKPLDEKKSTWVEPKLVCEVEYARITNDGLLREAVFLRLRPDRADAVDT
jgi:DNA ligase D-like protein (predicted ligase)